MFSAKFYICFKTWTKGLWLKEVEKVYMNWTKGFTDLQGYSYDGVDVKKGILDY